MLDPSESLSQKFVRRGAWLYLFAFLTGPIGYVVKIITSHDLTVEEVGVIYGVLSLVSLLSVYHDLGLTESMNYFLPKCIVEKNYSRFKSIVAYSLFAQIITSGIIGGVLFFISGPLAEYYFQSSEALPVIQVLCLFFLGMNLHAISTTIFGVSQNTKLQKWAEFFRMLAILVFVACAWILDSGTLMVYAWMWNVGVFAGICFGAFFAYRDYYLPYLKDVPIRFEKDLAKEIVRYSLWVMLAANVGTLLAQVDMQLIVYLLGTQSAGYYTNYLTIIGIPFIFVTPIIAFLFPVISELHGKAQHEKITTIKSLFYKYFSVLGIITGIFLFVFGPEIAVVLFGEKFRESGNILRYSAFFIVFNYLLQIDFQLLAGVGQIRKRVQILLIGLVFNVILNVLLIHRLGASGSALAVGISWIPIWYAAHRLTREYTSGFDIRFFLKNLAIAVVFGAVLFFGVLPYLGHSSRLVMFVWIVFAGVFYIIPFVVGNMQDIRLFISEIRNIRSSKNLPPTDATTDTVAV